MAGVALQTFGKGFQEIKSEKQKAMFKNHRLPDHHCHQRRDRAQGSYGEAKACSRLLESSLANTTMCQTVFAAVIFRPALRAP